MCMARKTPRKVGAQKAYVKKMEEKMCERKSPALPSTVGEIRVVSKREKQRRTTPANAAGSDADLCSDCWTRKILGDISKQQKLKDAF